MSITPPDPPRAHPDKTFRKAAAGFIISVVGGVVVGIGSWFLIPPVPFGGWIVRGIVVVAIGFIVFYLLWAIVAVLILRRMFNGW